MKFPLWCVCIIYRSYCKLNNFLTIIRGQTKSGDLLLCINEINGTHFHCTGVSEILVTDILTFGSKAKTQRRIFGN